MKIVFLLLLLIAFGVHGWRCSTHEVNKELNRPHRFPIKENPPRLPPKKTTSDQALLDLTPMQEGKNVYTLGELDPELVRILRYWKGQATEKSFDDYDYEDLVAKGVFSDLKERLRTTWQHVKQDLFGKRPPAQQLPSWPEQQQYQDFQQYPPPQAQQW
ncbi:unnamed protein product [Caenorhabditis auriculariae]|uniref:Secreted protein n=1 Tax=Caenorhabditis auriculariae TaxID=2777116 RepID=A0A8S1H1N6_9PELO|nr:unnamed protein product [Caenorhabditis auriculariae]